MNKLDNQPLANFDVKLDSSSVLNFADKSIEIIETPGHTPDSITFKIDDYLFVGDTLFAPKRGTSRVDFPGGSADDLYHSIESLYEFPSDCHVQLCHDYPNANEEPISSISIQDEIDTNVMLNGICTEKEFVEKRCARDAQLSMPKLLDVAVPFNLTHRLIL